MTITHAAAVNSLVNSHTSKQRNRALNQMESSSSTQSTDLQSLFWEWREKLIDCQASLEASLNFHEDDDINSDQVVLSVKTSIHEVLQTMKRIIKKLEVSSTIDSGIKVAIVGSPNVGKSSLMNVITQRHTSIVSEFEGTTRDSIETLVDFMGWPIIFVDTAGLRESLDIIEQLGVAKSKEMVSKEADFVVHVSSTDKADSPETENFLSCLQDLSVPVLRVVNKFDLVENDETFDRKQYMKPYVLLSCTQEKGFDEFYNELDRLLTENYSVDDDSLVMNAPVAHRHLLSDCILKLQNVEAEEDEVLIAETLRSTLFLLSQFTENVHSDDVLDRMFSNFCIGK